jgi:lipoprotein-anchoring transpeptidase ErfK/SrfK
MSTRTSAGASPTLRRSLLFAAILIVIGGLAVTGCAGKGPYLEPSATQTLPPIITTTTTTAAKLSGVVTTVATARNPVVGVYDRPRYDRKWELTLANPQPSGAPLIFVVKRETSHWLLVYLPVRPNGSIGWIRKDTVRLSRHNFRILVELNAHRIWVYQGTSLIMRAPVAIGRARTPTPSGFYYTKELLRPKDPNGLYGPYAYGLSGFSSTLSSFAGGDGVIGIHGTNEPWLLGRDVSHGCIRLSNADITRLAHLLPLGVPVTIVV